MILYINMQRPDFFYFMVYRHFCSLSNVGIRNKNKNKISVMSDIPWLSSLFLAILRNKLFRMTENLILDILIPNKPI